MNIGQKFLSILIVFFLMATLYTWAYASDATALTAGATAGATASTTVSATVSEVEDPRDILVLVNKSNSLPADYVPENLRVVNLPSVGGKDQLRDVAACALEGMFGDAKKAGHILYARSGYRSYSRQSAIFYGYVKGYGRTLTETFSAPPGMSEHQTGLTMDISSKSANYALVKKFGQLPEGIWVKDNSWKYGFIIRYPEDKTHITKYTYEPWHLRYVGLEAARAIHKKDITLEEYLDSIKWKEDTFAVLTNSWSLTNQIIWEEPKLANPLFA
jgi:LAS superfamily LD-carboxypeptidase LdcB